MFNIFGSKQKSLDNFIPDTTSNGFYSIFNPRGYWDSDYINLYKGWSYAAITKISESLTLLDYQSKNRAWKVNKDKDLQLLSLDLFDNITQYLKLTWTAYVRKHKINNKVKSLEVLKTDSVHIEYQGDNKTVDYYTYNFRWDRERIEVSEMIVISDFNPSLPDKWNTRGYGNLRAVQEQLKIEESTLSFNRDFFDNDWTPGIILTSDRDISSDVRKRYIEGWKQQFTWRWNKFKSIFLERGIDIKTINPSQKDIDFVEQRKFTRDEILAVFWVPKALLGLAEWVNVWNVKAFEDIFHKNVILPLARKIEDVFNRDRDIFKDSTFEFVKSFLVDQEEARKDYESGILTLNEIRATKGLDPIEGWDKVKNSSTQVEITEEV